PSGVKAGEYALAASVTSAAARGATFTNGYQEIEYPHVQRRQVIKPAEIAVKVVDVKTVPNVTVGYVAGAGDQVPPAIEQLGAKSSRFQLSQQDRSADVGQLGTGAGAVLPRREGSEVCRSRLDDRFVPGQPWREARIVRRGARREGTMDLSRIGIVAPAASRDR